MFEDEGPGVAICQCCRMWVRVHMAMGDWARTCTLCNKQCAIGMYDDLWPELGPPGHRLPCPHSPASNNPPRSDGGVAF